MSRGFGGTKRYRVVRALGAGGMGEVYEVEDRGSGARVALKRMLAADARRLLRFKQEFRLMAELHHPNLVRLFDLATEDGDWFFTMELVRGDDLLRVLLDRDDGGEPGRARGSGDTAAIAAGLAATADTGPGLAVALARGSQPELAAVTARRRPACEPEPLLAVLAQLLDALEFLHGQGVVHRDLKPSNVLVDLDGRVRVLDFGLVSRIDRAEAISQDGVVVGTMAYLSPEQLLGEAASPASDLYALGCLLFQLLTGALPFADGEATAFAGRFGRPPRVDARVDGVAPALVDIVERLMAVDPRERPALDDVRAALGLARSSGPRTDRLARLTASGERFVGRAAELAVLAGCLDAAVAGRAQLALVAGPSGIGKSALADEVVRRATAAGFACLRGRSYEREQVPFVAFDRVMDAITVALQRWPRERVAPLVPALRALARIFPALALLTEPEGAGGAGGATGAVAGDASDPRELRRRAFDGFARLLAHWQVEAPVLLVLDDLQWADDESLALLEALATGGPGRIAILALARRDAGGAHTVAARARRLGAAVTSLELAPMPVADAVELVDAVGGGALDDRTARALADQAGGNPFLVRRLAEHLVGLDPEARAAVLDAAGSSDDVLRAIIRALPADAEQLLALAATAGGDVSTALLRATSGLSAAGFELAAGELIAARLWKTVPGGARADDAAPRVDLYHDRIREVVYRGLDDERRRALHRALAAALESAGGHDVEALARHWGAAGDRAQRRRWALEAAEQAAGKLAFRRAAELLRLAQAEPDDGEPTTITAARWERIGLLHELGGDLRSAGDAYRHALARWERHAERADVDRRRHALLRLRGRAGLCLTAAGELALGRALFADGLASLGLPLDRSLAGRALVLARLALRDRLAARRGSAARAGRVGPDDPWIATRARFFDEMLIAFEPLYPLFAAEAALRASLDGRRCADQAVRVHALAFTAAAPVAQRRSSPATLARCNRLLDGAEAVAREHAVPLGLEHVQINRAVLWLPVDPARACRVLDAAVDALASAGMADSFDGNRARGHRLVLHHLIGDHDTVLAAAERELAGDDNNQITRAVAQVARVWVGAARGDLELARAAATALREQVPRAPASARLTMVSLAEIAVDVAAGDFAAGLARADEGERWLRASGAWVVGMNRTAWTEPVLEAALGVARKGGLAPRDRRRAYGWARWMAAHGHVDFVCMGDRALALLARAGGDARAARRAIDRALARSSANTSPHHRWLCLEAARDLGALTHDLDVEASELAARHRFVLPPGWRPLALS